MAPPCGRHRFQAFILRASASRDRESSWSLGGNGLRVCPRIRILASLWPQAECSQSEPMRLHTRNDRLQVLLSENQPENWTVFALAHQTRPGLIMRKPNRHILRGRNVWSGAFRLE